MLTDCPHERNEKVIAERKNAILNFRNCGGNTNGNENGKNDKEKDKDKNKRKDPLKQPPQAGESHEKKINGKLEKWCGKCGRWGNHLTADHKSKEELQKEKTTGGATKETEKTVSFAGATALNFG